MKISPIDRYMPREGNLSAPNRSPPFMNRGGCIISEAFLCWRNKFVRMCQASTKGRRTGRIRRMEKRVEEPQFVVGIEFDDVSYPGNHARFFASLIAVDPVPPGFRWFLGSDQTEQVVRFIKRSDDYAAKRKRCLERSKTRASVDQLLSLEND